MLGTKPDGPHERAHAPGRTNLEASHWRELGPEALRKQKRLPRVADNYVTSTIYELLVGAALVRNGVTLQMLPETSTESPDFRIHNELVPLVLECKRRMGPSDFELEEGRHVGALAEALFDVLPQRAGCAVLDVEFKADVHALLPAQFQEEVFRCLRLAHLADRESYTVVLQKH
ncbi:MAG: hypothetical protein ACYDAG_13625 [Chloroflexota bacterium]